MDKNDTNTELEDRGQVQRRGDDEANSSNHSQSRNATYVPAETPILKRD